MDTPQSTGQLPLRRPAGGVTRLDAVDGALVVTLAGVLTADCCAELRGTLMRGRPEALGNVRLDASAVSAIEDGVLGVLLACSAYVHSTGGELTFTAASASVRRAIDALGLADLFPLPTAPAYPGLPTAPADRPATLTSLLPQQRRPLDSVVGVG